MTPIDRVIATSQIFALVAWEALGIIAFGWDALTIAAVWFVGLWSFNILTATAVRTYFKLTENATQVHIEAPTISAEDIDVF